MPASFSCYFLRDFRHNRFFRNSLGLIVVEKRNRSPMGCNLKQREQTKMQFVSSNNFVFMFCLTSMHSFLVEESDSLLNFMTFKEVKYLNLSTSVQESSVAQEHTETHKQKL